ncbi:MAG: hypothetical protein ACI93T_003363, partial [Porticoccaceae bacterium]
RIAVPHVVNKNHDNVWPLSRHHAAASSDQDCEKKQYSVHAFHQPAHFLSSGDSFEKPQQPIGARRFSCCAKLRLYRFDRRSFTHKSIVVNQSANATVLMSDATTEGS